MTEPRTEAGRRLLGIGEEFKAPRPEYAVLEVVLAIEEEAAQLALAAARARIKNDLLREVEMIGITALPETTDATGAFYLGFEKCREAVLSIIR